MGDAASDRKSEGLRRDFQDNSAISEKSIAQGGMEVKETEDENGEKIRYSTKESTSSQIRKAMAGTKGFTQRHVYLGETPKALVDILGIEQLPMLMTTMHIYQATRAKRKYIGYYHSDKGKG